MSSAEKNLVFVKHKKKNFSFIVCLLIEKTKELKESVKMTDANEKLVVVTGATGHVGSWIVKDLLDHGYRVRATVRNIKQSRYDFLKQMDKANRLELVEFDLVKDDAKSFASNVLKDDCELVIHTASPYFLSVKDATRDLVNPAVQGSLKVLEACSFPSSKVKRVIVTSSIAAITDSPKRDYVYTELDWNESSGLSRNPYYLSKAMSERKAHEWYRQKNPPFVLIFLNPSLCIGPQLNPGGAINTSNRIFLNCVDGYYPVSFAGAWPFVDVRDVAELHRIVLERTDIPHGRYIVHKQSLWMKVRDKCVLC